MNDSCIFCSIIAGKSPADVLYRDDQATAFRDLHPKAPVHILIVPNRHIAAIAQMETGDEALIGHLFTVANELADREGLAGSGYRLIINNGRDAGQAVYHIHLHLLGGRRMGFDL